MIQFNRFISEGIEQYTKLKHLEHAEDLPIDSGEHGYHHSVEALHNVHKKLQGKFNETKVTTKFDGSPSIVFGHNPENGKFFVASKSAFNKTPKLNYTTDDIAENHGNSPGLAAKLQVALEHLPKIAPKHGVYQGDMMYGPGDVVTHKDEHNFTPNTIQYSTPVKSDEGKKISKAKMGIVIHTKYHGKNLDQMQAGFEPDLNRFTQNPDVHVINHEIGEVVHPQSNQNKFEQHMKMAETTHMNAGKSLYGDIKPHAGIIKTYINKTVREDEKPSLEGYRQYLMSHGAKNVESVKTTKFKQLKTNEMLANLRHVEDHLESFKDFFKIHHHMTQAKNALVDTLSNNSQYEHSIGGEESKPEGFVAVHKGHPIKLVNRSEFSKANFNRSRET